MDYDHDYSERYVAPYYRSNPIRPFGLGEANDGATGGFVSQHPWLTTYIVLSVFSAIILIAEHKS